MVQLFWDKEQMVVGMYFNSAANKIPDNYQLSEHQGTRGGYRIVSRKLFSQMETTLENCKSKGSLLFVPELCEEEGSNRDFYIVRLVK